MYVKTQMAGAPWDFAMSASQKHNPERSPKAIGARVALIREIAGLTQEAFAAQIRKHHRKPTSQGTVSAWISGKRPPGLEAGQALCDAFNVTLDWIYRGDEGGITQSMLREINKRR